ncbi:glycosyltransferase family 4 protein [Ornithinimicrobium ciconiae]|uniref:D-inositol 3-phosphate glycosyltransferase n=1 Tax=Ornithinimicrobium ciconiae TaxID=2594265 RepID=A0A516G7B4_9MICO|nr:glycosyltransferase family 4 protein [Ornithinimicrobium ciconiae]QDO87426.1 glycosyltransferase family 4 protein [Ornithinimicrobium ciconiae]
MSEGTKRRRIALVASSYHPHFGGVEEHVRHVAAELAIRGHAVEVWTVDRGDHLGVQEVDGIRVRYLRTPMPARRTSNLARFAFTAPVALARWLAAARAFKPDLVHVHCFGPNGPYARLVAALIRVPWVLSSHGETFMDANDVFGQSALMRQQLRRGCETADVVTGCSIAVAEDLQSHYGAHGVEVVPNGVRALSASELDQHGTARGRGRVVAVGRLVHVKGFDLLVDAVARSTEIQTLDLVGEGPESEALKRQVERLGLEDRVSFLGRRSPEEVQQLMAAADVVAMPSRREAFGIVALEAWVSGTPLVATTLGGPAGFVTDGVDGVLVDPQDTAALARAIDGLLSDPDRARTLAARGRETVRDYTWDRVVDHYEAIYSTLPTD